MTRHGTEPLLETHDTSGKESVARLSPWALVGIVGLVIALLADAPLQGADTAPTVEEQAVAQAKSLSIAFRNAARAVIPTVVQVRTSQQRKPKDPLSDLFGGPSIPNDGNREMGLGSGVIVDPSGVVLTNHHVVENADTVTIQLPDGRVYPAEDVHSDPDSDLAVVRFHPEVPLENVAKLGDSDALDIGDWVIAVGSPFELEGTVSAGIISARDRTLPSVGRARFLQTDAAINPGNSGGPLVDLDGNVVGINTAIFSRNGGYQGIGFAIPINRAKWVMQQLLEYGKVRRAYIGVSIDKVTPPDAEVLGIPLGRGVIVNRVFRESPADKAGLQVDDVILSFDGVSVAAPGDLQEVVERAELNKPHELVIVRDGKQMKLSISVELMPETSQLARRMEQNESEVPDKPRKRHYDKDLGLMICDYDRALGRTLGVDVLGGVVVISADTGKPAHRSGLRSGMVILRAAGERVADVDALLAILEKADLEQGIVLEVADRAGRQVIRLKTAE
ncbi:MAG: PDZ domain-containing protein [Planctomycetota bacterium]|nr:MAG: PDZ domain-containing protein [Planctomycetota bacterium]